MGQVIIVPDPESLEATDLMSELESLLIVAQVLAHLWQLLRLVSVEMRFSGGQDLIHFSRPLNPARFALDVAGRSGEDDRLPRLLSRDNLIPIATTPPWSGTVVLRGARPRQGVRSPGLAGVPPPLDGLCAPRTHLPLRTWGGSAAPPEWIRS